MRLLCRSQRHRFRTNFDKGNAQRHVLPLRLVSVAQAPSWSLQQTSPGTALHRTRRQRRSRLWASLHLCQIGRLSLADQALRLAVLRQYWRDSACRPGKTCRGISWRNEVSHQVILTIILYGVDFACEHILDVVLLAISPPPNTTLCHVLTRLRTDWKAFDMSATSALRPFQVPSRVITGISFSPKFGISLPSTISYLTPAIAASPLTIS